MLTDGSKEWYLMNDIKRRIDEAPEGYIPIECYEATKMRADKLEKMWRAEHSENKRFREMYDQICEALLFINKERDINDKD